MARTSAKLQHIFTRLVIDDEGRACRDIPESACQEEPRNFLTHVVSLALTKAADGFIDPKLVLSWLLSSLGAPAALIGLLVPIREAGALLPQLFTAGAIRKLPLRKYAWAVGSILQGLCAICIAIAAISLPKTTSPYVILGLLAILAISRSVCSVAYKDVLGKTVAKTRRGSAAGLAGSVAAISVIGFALLLSLNLMPRMSLVIAALFLGGGCFVMAGVIFTRLSEEKGAVDGGKSAIRAAIEDLSYLRTKRDLRTFIITRALLTATALAPPFMVAAAQQKSGAGFAELGYLVFASAIASLLSSYIWGRLSDRSSRKVLILSALIACIVLGLTSAAAYANWLGGAYVLPSLLFVLMIAYQGVRLGRATHLVDMATPDTRAAYTALSNTVIGVILMFGSLFGVIAAIFGTPAVLTLMSAMCAMAILFGLQLKEVQTLD